MFCRAFVYKTFSDSCLTNKGYVLCKTSKTVAKMSIPSSQRLSSSSSYFKDMLTKVGIKIQISDTPNILEKEQVLIIRDIQKEIENHTNYPNNVADFISGVKYFCRSKSLFKKSLQQSVLQKQKDIRGSEQESLFRILLNVNVIQSDVISILLDELTVHVDEEEGMVWLRLLLKPLLFLPFISDSHTLTFRILEILEIAINTCQIELLNYIPDIVPDNDHDEIAKKLNTIFNQSRNNNDLICAIIHCLNRLNLSDDAIFDIEDNILALLNSTSSLATFSLIFYFLVTNCKSSNLQNILLKTRNALEGIMETLTETDENKSNQLLTFEQIESITTSSKAISEGWISLLNCFKSANDHKSIDIIILMMLHKNNKHATEAIFKKKVKNRQIKTVLLETALSRYIVPQILKDYITSILEISACLLRMTEPCCIEFAQIFYLQIYGHKYSDIQQRQQIVRAFITLTGSGDKIRSQTLRVLKIIADQHLELLQAQAMQLMNLLDRIEDSDLGDIKQIYDLLSTLTCGPRANSSMEAYQNMIHIMVKKQLRIHKKSLKFSGIIGAVAIARNIATTLDEEQNNTANDASIGSISDLPNEPARQAANLLELAIQSSSSCPISQGLFYDQLAQMIVSAENLDNYFLAWLQTVITKNFESIYITSNAPEPINDITLLVQYNLNSAAEIEEPIAVQISELTINTNENNTMMLVFAPLFRLLRLITSRQNDKDLSIIDALLGCGVILPEIDPDIGIENYDSQQAPQVADCLFHCINWFRETINAFVDQKQRKIKEKVLLRLKNLVELEEIFMDSMKTLPEHKLPPSYFYNVHLDSSSSSANLNKTKSDRGRKRKHPDNTTKIISPSTQASTSKSTKKTAPKEKEAPKYNFREMDTDIILLLKYPLIATDDPIPENKLYLTFPQFKFILKDVVTKLNTVTKTSNSNVFSHLITVKPEELITDCVKLMPHINQHLIKIIDETKKLLERSDGIHDSHEMFLQAATELKICFSLNLEMQSLVLSWAGFQIGKNLQLLRECLRAFVAEEKSSQLISARQLILEYLKCILALADYCLTLQCAVHLINIVKNLCNISTDITPKKKLVMLSGKLLSIRWFNLHGLPESGAVANLHIDTLVKAHLSETKLEIVSNIVSWIHEECSDLKSKDDNLTTFPSITKANFPILYRGVCASLLGALQNELHGLTNHEHLDVWLSAVTTMKNLMDIVKIQETRVNLAAFLKRSLGIIKVFLAQGLPILEIMIKDNSDKVVEILRKLQQTTRFIHNLCCYSKVIKDTTLIKHVPQMRLTLETLVYRVKAALGANNCLSAFWMGALKNKDLHGEEILSQSTNSTVDDQQEDENEADLPADEESDEESMRSAVDESDDLSLTH